MTQIHSYKYKQYSINISVSAAGKFYATCISLNISSIGDGSGNGGWSTMSAVQTVIESQIDQFLQSSITCIENLALEINDKLTFHGYDGVDIDPTVLKNILLQCSPDFLTLHKY